MLKIYSLLCEQVDYYNYFTIYTIASSKEEAKVSLEKRIQALNLNEYDIIQVGEIECVSGKTLVSKLPWLPVSELQNYDIDYTITRKEKNDGER